jgi:hypothetical protein
LFTDKLYADDTLDKLKLLWAYSHFFLHADIPGGFGSYLLAMSDKIAAMVTEANNAQNIKDPQLGWIIGFLFLVSFIGLFGLVPLRKVQLYTQTQSSFLVNQVGTMFFLTKLL